VRSVPALAAAAALALGALDPSAIALLTLRPWPLLVIDAARRISDVDRDGYGAWLAGGDCAPFDPAIHPAAREQPGNGRDDNCLLGDAPRRPSRTAAPASASARPSGTRPVPFDLVLITIDSLRADRVGAYAPRYAAAGLATTPQLDDWARTALRFDRAYTTGGWTSIAISALMRGRYPRALAWTPMFETASYRLVSAAIRDKLGNFDRATKMFPLPVEDRHPTLAQWLGERGMHTIAVVDDGYSEVLSPGTRLAPGFDVVREVDSLPKPRRGDSATVDLALEALAAVPPDQRFFLWVHFFGPHSPSTRHRGVRRDGNTPVQAYEHEIRYLDQQLGRLIAFLDE
jgi:arylsulfatase A-like enzyme